MDIFGPREHDGGWVQTFRAPAPPPAPTPAPHRALERLLVAATEAEKAGHALASLKAFYARSPSPEVLQRLLVAAADALEKEIVFDELWEEVSKDWFERPVLAAP